MGLSHSPSITTDGLVLCLDAANPRSYPGSGSTWYDLSGNGYIDTFGSSPPTYSSDNGGVLIFDGSSNRTTIGSLGLNGLTELTVNIWFISSLFSSGLVRSLDGVNSFILHWRGAGFYLVKNTGVASGYLGWQTPPPYNQWLMLTATWDGATMKLYQNAVKQNNELSFTGTLRDINLIELGYYFNSSQPYTGGRMSNFSFYNRALSANEVQRNYLATKSRFGL